MAHLTFHHPFVGSLYQEPVPDENNASSGACFGVHSRGCTPSDEVVPELLSPRRDRGHEPLTVEKGSLGSVMLQCQGLEQEAGGDRVAQSADPEPTNVPLSPEWKVQGGQCKTREHFLRLDGTNCLQGKICIFSVYSLGLYNSEMKKSVKPQSIPLTRNSNNLKA